MTRKISVTIELDGSIQIAVTGVAGPGCKQMTADLERALGEVVNDVTTPEYHQQPQRTGQTQPGGPA